MFYLKDHLMAHQHILDVVPTRNVDTTGRFNILVPKAEMKVTRGWFTDNFNALWDQVPLDQKPHDEAFFGPPGISSLTYHSDDEDSGTSTLSMSAASFASLSDILDDVPDNFQTPVEHVSYAAAVTGGDKESQTTTESPSELTKQTEVHPDLNKLHEEIAALKQDNERLRNESIQKSADFEETLHRLATKEATIESDQRAMLQMIRDLQMRLPDTKQQDSIMKRSTTDDDDSLLPSSKRIDQTDTPAKRNLDPQFTQEMDVDFQEDG